MRHFLDLKSVSADEVRRLLKDTARLKSAESNGARKATLAGRVLGMIFEKPSLRTRVSFQTAMAQLGGSSIFLMGNEVGLGTRETVPDCARTLNEYVDAVVLRTFHHATVEEYAKHSTRPVINGLSDYSHPCQALADFFTIQELFGEIKGRTVVFVGDGNNVARSLASGCALLGAKFVLCAPNGYGFDEPFLRAFRRDFPKGELTENGAPAKAVRQSDVIYTDVWTSMGQEAEREDRLKRFAGYQVNEKLLKLAPAHARVMHCLPAHRGEEVTDAVLDGDRSVVFQQAGNRLHAQKALLQRLLA